MNQRSDRDTSFVTYEKPDVSPNNTVLQPLINSEGQNSYSLKPPVQHFQTDSGREELSKGGPERGEDEHSQGRQSDSCQGEQLSDSQSDCSSVLVDPSAATLPKYDFHMSATQLAAFLAIFNITKNKLEGVGFAL